MSDKACESSSDEEQMTSQKKKKRLYSTRIRTNRIIAAGPSQDAEVPTAESELLDFRNRVSPPTGREAVHVVHGGQSNTFSDYDASCESLDLKTSYQEARDNTESEATATPGVIRCQEQPTNDDLQEGESLPPPADARLSFDAGYLASSDSFSTSDIHDVVTRYAHDPDVSQWTQNKNPEIRVHYQIIYDQPSRNRLPIASRAADITVVPPEETAASTTFPKMTRLNYRETGATSSGGSVRDSSVSIKQEPTEGGSHSDAVVEPAAVIYDEAFEEMLINRIQNRIRELGGVDELEPSDQSGLTLAGRQVVKQRYGFLMRDVSDEDDEEEATGGAAGGAERGRRRRRRRTPDWLLTDAPSDETLRTELDAPPSTVTLGLDDGPNEPPPPRYRRSPDSESEVSALRAIRADGGDQFVDAVLWRLQENLRAGHNFREYRESTAGKSAYTRRPTRQQTSSDDDSDAASSRSSTGRVQFKDRVLVRPLGRDPLLTEYRRPYSKVSKQKLSSLREYKSEPDDPDYEDSLKDRAEPTAAKPPGKSTPAAGIPAPPPAKQQPGWKKLFCCISGGSADDTTPKPGVDAAAPPPAVAPPAAPPPPPAAAAAPPSPELKRKRRRVKMLPVQELDPDISNDELRSLHMMFDDRVELCGLSEPATEASLEEPSELSDPDSDAEPCFSDFLKACGLKEDKVNEYMKFYKTHKGLVGSGHGDWTATRHSPDGRPDSVSSTDDPGWWDRRARQRRHEFRCRRRQHREYQRQLETQRDLEVEGQLRRALETQRELLREREVERELERTQESSKDRKELRLEEEVLEKELLRRLLAELQNEQVRSREREKRRTVARILEEELITRLTLALARQREKSEERRGQHETQRIDEEATTRELNNRIEELRMRIEENKILRDYERDEEQERLKLLEELLVKERRRMDILETSRLQEQDDETKTRAVLTELEERSGEDEVKSQKDYEYCAKTLLKKNELHKAMRQKLTTEIRKRELVKRKLVSLSDIEKSNPRLFQLAKVMEEVTNEKGCLQLEYAEPGSGILKKDIQVEGEGELFKTEETEGEEAKTEETEGEEAKTEETEGEKAKTEEDEEGPVKVKEETRHNDEPTPGIEETAASIKQEPPDNDPQQDSQAPAEIDAAGQVTVALVKKEEPETEPESSTTEDTGGETDLEPPRRGETSDSNEDTKPPVPQSEAVADSQPSDELSDGEAPPPPPTPVGEAGEADSVEVMGEQERGQAEAGGETQTGSEVDPKIVDIEGAEGAVQQTEVLPTEATKETTAGEQQQQRVELPADDAVTLDSTAEPPQAPAEVTQPAEPAAEETVRFKESGVQVNRERPSPVPPDTETPRQPPARDAGPDQTDESGTDGEVTAVLEPSHSDSQEDPVQGSAEHHEDGRTEGDRAAEAPPPEPAAAERQSAESEVVEEGTVETGEPEDSATGTGVGRPAAAGTVPADAEVTEVTEETRATEETPAEETTAEGRTGQPGETEAGAGEEITAEERTGQPGETEAGAGEETTAEGMTGQPGETEAGTGEETTAEERTGQPGETEVGAGEAPAPEPAPERPQEAGERTEEARTADTRAMEMGEDEGAT